MLTCLRESTLASLPSLGMSLYVDSQNSEILHRDRQSALSSLANTSDGNLDLQKEAVEDDDEEEDVDFNPFLVGETLSEASSSLSSEDEGSALNRQGTDASPRATDDTRSCARVSENDYGEVVMQTSLPLGHNVSSSLNPITEMDEEEEEEEEEDAICRRTRARHSLANYTLEDLETFLQESDDDGNLQNADEEEEYHRFLAAVLVGGGDDVCIPGQGNEILDEDEENDADFEIEIEEALESDVDESVNCVERSGIYVHRPETRQKSSNKDCAKNKEKLLGQAKLPLRPILPSVSNAQVAPCSSLGWSAPSARIVPHFSSPSSNFDVAYGFTAKQIGQLYCLIHEHVQLLVQVFTLSVVDPSRQHIASSVEKMISEMVDKREEALAWRKVPYPASIFGPWLVQPSVPGDRHQTANGSPWAPIMSGPVVSLLDVASLSLARGYMTDVSATMSDYRRSQVEVVHDRTYLLKEPLFPLPSSTHFCETSNEVLGGCTTSCQNTKSSHSACKIHPKKSLAATIVESTKKQSVALVPKDIAKLIRRFFSLFNSALFPHKPPRPPIANRVLFTDAEDGLLAMGIMEHNTDRESIKRRFLPCKNVHQIFVRQKNRSSSKAPENPIKAVRRMKNSPLTADEKALIYEGLKVFKNDWNLVWKCFVPHRDPILLSRQWRIATGTQKSYRKDEAINEKRRLYEAKRRMFKAAMTHQKSLSENEVNDSGENTADDYMDDEDEAYVHEAFLADLEPEGSDHMPLELPLSSIRKSKMQSAFNELPFRRIPRDDKSKAVSAPYQTYNTTASKVVKLAPDLPPVILGPSGRVISQSAFKNYTSVDSVSTRTVPSIPHATKSGTSPVNSDRHTSMLSYVGTKNDHTHDPRAPSDHRVTEESNSEFDLQMHPLLFQASEDGCPPCLPKNCGPTTSSTFNTFSGHPLQANLDLLLKHQLSASVVGCPPVPRSKEPPLNSHTIDFHPLLQRTVNINGDTVLVSPDGHLSELEPLRRGHANHFNSLDCILSEPGVSGAQSIASTASISQYEKENELDLDIHLYSATNKEKTTGGRNMKGHPNIGSRSISALGNRRVEKAHDAYLPSQDEEQYHETLIATNSTECAVKNIVSNDKSNACPEASVYSATNGAYQCTEDYLADQPFPEIVMEQEELSDSDEEIENVEFECEEMDDSEGEGLDGEQPPENHNQEFLLTDKEDTDEDPDGQHRPRPNGKGGESSASTLQLCSDSFPANLKLANPKPESVNRGPYYKAQPNELHSHPSQSSNKQNKKRARKLHSQETPELHLYTGSEWNSVASRKGRRRLQK